MTQNIPIHFLHTIDSEGKAYILGWLTFFIKKNDTTISISRNINDSDIMHTMCDIISPKIQVKKYLSTVETRFKSAEMHSDICRHLGLDSGKIQFPKLANKALELAFIRGLFDATGIILVTSENIRICSIPFGSLEFLKNIGDVLGVKYNITDKYSLHFSGVSSVDFLSKIYDIADKYLILQSNYKAYLEILSMKNITDRVLECKYSKTADAIAPSKKNCSDEGYDLHLISIDKKISEDTIRYDTGIKVQPPEGWHVEIIPRSSLSQSGYCLSNSIGLIDSSYRGTLRVTLTKIDKAAKDIELPFKAVQMILRQNVHYLCKEINEDELDQTERGEGGFGSTDKKQG